jgi:hypothetical protein
MPKPPCQKTDWLAERKTQQYLRNQGRELLAIPRSGLDPCGSRDSFITIHRDKGIRPDSGFTSINGKGIFRDSLITGLDDKGIGGDSFIIVLKDKGIKRDSGFTDPNDKGISPNGAIPALLRDEYNFLFHDANVFNLQAKGFSTFATQQDPTQIGKWRSRCVVSAERAPRLATGTPAAWPWHRGAPGPIQIKCQRKGGKPWPRTKPSAEAPR